MYLSVYISSIYIYIYIYVCIYPLHPKKKGRKTLCDYIHIFEKKKKNHSVIYGKIKQ